ncbi:MAG: hypothetical protein JNJ62_09355 [Pseudoxanthomonas mexicana]|nr:hypothetical protein [Pseudoxanthomonas mexicana]
MSASENPYRSPLGVIDADSPGLGGSPGARPLGLWVLLLCYAWYYLLETASWLLVGRPGRTEFIVAIAIGVYSLCVGICLWRGVNWVRWWVVITTLLVLLLLWFMASRFILDDNVPAVLACLLRVAIAVMLFLPSVRCWFAPRRV